jgi:hypothetical protein
VAMPVGKRDVLNGIGLGNRDPIPITSRLGHGLQTNKAVDSGAPLFVVLYKAGRVAAPGVERAARPRNFKKEHSR